MNSFSAADHSFMQQAIELAHTAKAQNEVPVGAIVVHNEIVVGSGFNQPIAQQDPTAHAEIIALRSAAQTLRNYRLIDTTLYVTLEPCAMCAAAMLHARIKRVVFAATDPKAGALGGAIDLYAAHSWNHRLQCDGGLMAQQCGDLLRAFFQARR